MKALFFGTFHSRHAANALLRDDLRRCGVDVEFCHEPLWEETRDKADAYFGPLSLFRLGARYGRAAVRLARRLAAAARDVDLVVTGFNGQLDVLLARSVLRICGASPRLVFAPLVTITETLVEDRQVYADGSLVARGLAALDRASLLAADLVLIDTAAHRDWIARRLTVPPERMRVQWLGADEIFRPAIGESPRAAAIPTPPPASTSVAAGAPPLRVLFYGSHLPLHGVGVVAEAARLLGPEGGVEFDWIGAGPEAAVVDAQLAGLPHVRRTEWVQYEELPARIAASDVVLGVFGTSVKAGMVVPNKVWQAAACGRAVVTADTPAVREVFTPGASLLTTRPDASSLATLLRELRDDRARCVAVGAAAARAVTDHAGAPVRATRLRQALEPPTAARVAAARVAAIVVTWEGGAVTRACVESVRASVGVGARVYVVDNGSSPSEQAALTQRWSASEDVVVVQLAENRHFAGGVNAGVERALAEGAEHLVILNNDTVLEPDCLARLVGAALEFPAAGIVGPELLDLTEPDRVLSIGERYAPWSVCWPRSLLRVRGRAGEGDGRPYRVGGVMGSALLVTAGCFRAVGAYREDLDVYYEEVDYCLRARSRGYRPVIVPGAVVRHDGMRGFASGLQPYAAYLKCRNLPVLARDHGTAGDRALFWPSYAALLLASSAVYLGRGNLPVVAAMWRGAADGLRLARRRPPRFGVPRR